MSARSRSSTADVCLVLEGTYPYVSGGVSTWVHQLIRAFPDLKFALFYLGAQKDSSLRRKYEIPANVTRLEEVFLFENTASLTEFRKTVPASWAPFYTTARKLWVRPPAGDLHDLELLRGLMRHIARNTTVSFTTFWQDPQTWLLLRELYERHTPEDSFIDFYWTCCFLVQPVWRLARSLARMPAARLYHTACTGYAGLAAALAAVENDTPLLLSEHGIYLRERITDICKSRWIPERERRHPGLAEPLGHLRQLWVGFFDIIGRICYHRAGAVVSLFEQNAAAQRHFGADPARLTVIPNGIRTEECDPLHQQRLARREQNPGSQVIGFLGRVVSIKDIKTLLHAARRVCDQLPAARFLIAGPAEEEPEYYQECLELRGQLGLGEQVEFLGAMERDKFLPTIDVMILTSISEGLPFVVIEALAAGIPVVSTDVGACAEILNGRPGDTPPIGPCGLLAAVGAANDLASACIRLLTDSALLDQMSASGRTLAARHYHERSVLDSYRALYDRLMAQSSEKSEVKSKK